MQNKSKRESKYHILFISFQCVYVRASSLDYKFHQRQNEHIEDDFYYLLLN